MGIARVGVAVVAVSAVLFAAPPASAQKIPPEVRSAFEGRVRRNASYAVVMQKGVPTTSIYGVKGDETEAFYSVDIKGGDWQTSQGWLDLNQVAADTLVLGEVMEVVDVTFKDNRIDLRMVSLEAHKVTRGTGFGATTKREPVSTNFKFFFPFAVRGSQDLPPVMEYVEAWLKFFPREEQARAFAAQLLAGTAPVAAAAGQAPAAAAAPPPAAPASTRKEIKAGMSMLEVIEVLGKPQKEVSFESKTRWTYPDLTVLFEGGRVKEVQF
jgi:hypothetical protein